MVDAFFSQKSLSTIIIEASPPSENILHTSIIAAQIAKMPKSDGIATLAIIIEDKKPITWAPPVFMKLQIYGLIEDIFNRQLTYILIFYSN
jgi:hypothetical protein